MQMSKSDVPDAENPKWTKEDTASAMTFSKLPKSVKRVIANIKRGPQKAAKKVPISIRLPPDVVAGLRAPGAGWQVRADEASRSWLEKRETVGN
jgi:uncharacterized protein (DUF4415 family)